MALEIRQNLRLTQTLIMTQKLQQAIKLLQLSRMELLGEIHQALETNPILEESPSEEQVLENPEPDFWSTPAETPSMLTSERVFLVGISMGGILALQLTLDHPHIVAKLVLVNSMAKLDLNKPLMWPYYFWRYLLIQTKGLETQAEVVAERLFPAPDDNPGRQR